MRGRKAGPHVHSQRKNRPNKKVTTRKGREVCCLCTYEKNQDNAAHHKIVPFQYFSTKGKYHSSIIHVR